MKKLLLFSLLLLFSCQEKSAKTHLETDPTAHIPVEDLFIPTGDVESDIVWVYEQGGPTPKLTESHDLILFPNSAYPDFAVKFVKPSPLLLVQVHQGLTYDNNFYNDFTLERAREISDFNSKALLRVIKHFKDQGKTVWVFGHSYGCYILVYHMWKEGTENADKYIPMACRLDMEMEVANGWSNGEFWVYDKENNFVPIKSTHKIILSDGLVVFGMQQEAAHQSKRNGRA